VVRTRTLSLDELRREGEGLMEDLSREYYLAGAGHKPESDLRSVYARHAPLTGDESLHIAREAFVGSSPGTEDHRAARMLLDWQVELATGRALAELDDRMTDWESTAVVRLGNGEEIEYERTPIAIGNSLDRAYRQEIEVARNALVARELAPLKRDRLLRERDLVDDLGLAESYAATFELLSGIPLAPLAAQCEALLRDTQPMWDDVFREVVRRELRIDPGDATRADALVISRAHRFDAGFPARDLDARTSKHVSEMGIDPRADGRIILDMDDRPGKRARAFCAPVRVPAEVYLVTRPNGGQRDWTVHLHELGHALHFAHMRPTLPFEYRWLGDNSVTESFAMLFDHRLMDAGWLKRYTDLGAGVPREYLRAAAFDELHMLRRYAAKLLYEISLHGDASAAGAPARYAERLTSATSFRYDEAQAFVDVDTRFYAARYLRAWQLQSVLGEALVQQFNDDWWRNPRAGPWMVAELFEEGQREGGGEVAKRIAGRDLEFDPVVRAIERLLQ
jgi:hypothetical protein